MSQTPPTTEATAPTRSSGSVRARAPLGLVAAVIGALTVSFVATAVGVFVSSTFVGATAAEFGPNGQQVPVRGALGADRAQVVALGLAGTLGVSGRSCDGPYRGSGFVAEDRLWTAAHLVRGGDVVKVDQSIDPILVPLRTVASGVDLALADPVAGVHFDLAADNPDVGTTVFVAGHADGGATVVREGTVHLYSDGETWGFGGNVMVIDVVTEPGFSGGPVVDIDGRVVAMLQGFSEPLGLTLAIPVADLRYWSEAPSVAMTETCLID